MQKVGRGERVHADSNDLVVIDMVGTLVGSQGILQPPRTDSSDGSDSSPAEG
jgi:hypothetical protein